MWRAIASNFLTLAIVALVLVAGVIGWGRSEYISEGPLEQAICLRVESGSNIGRVSESLAEEGAVSQPAIFRIGAKYSGRADALKAGSYLVESQASMEDIVGQITGTGVSTCGTEVVYRIGVTGQEIRVRELDPSTNRFEEVAAFDPASVEPPAEYADVRDASDTRFRVAMAEGVTSWQVVEALKAADFLQGEVAEVPPEGSLAPDSYEVAPGASREELLARMTAAQEARLAEVWQGRDADLPIETPEEALILASLIEKETGVAEERRQVASVFVNRLNEGMRLQTDPTVIYGITGGQGVLGRGLRRSELDRETPYNTYRIAGLPPTPIANPGLESLRAAVNPAETEYLFFVADGTGGHAFAETLAQHNENVAKWRAIEAQQQGN
jgi:UPF0755 protein